MLKLYHFKGILGFFTPGWRLKKYNGAFSISNLWPCGLLSSFAKPCQGQNPVLHSQPMLFWIECAHTFHTVSLFPLITPPLTVAASQPSIIKWFSMALHTILHTWQRLDSHNGLTIAHGSKHESHHRQMLISQPELQLDLMGDKQSPITKWYRDKSHHPPSYNED